MQNNKFSKVFSGKGYYIALILCAVAIGLSGLLYYQTAGQAKPDTPAIATDEAGEVIGPQPTNPSANPTTPNGGDAAKPPMQTASPVKGETVGNYAMDCLVYNPTTRDWRTHNGIDIAAAEGTEVCAAANGTVSSVYDDPTMGKTVVISHEDGYSTRYSSLAETVSVQPGDKVVMGQAIGKVGLTALLECAIGEHVHFSVEKDQQSVNPQHFFALNQQ